MNRLSRWFMVVLAVLVLPGTVFPALAQEGEPITLVPFTSENFGIHGVVPEGWREAAPGVYTRGSNTGDITSLIQQAVPGMDAEAVATMLLPSLNLTELPEPSGTLETAYYTWTLYDITLEVSGLSINVAMALAEDEAGATLVLLQTLADEFDALHEAVYLPTLQALAPLAEEALATDYIEEFVQFPGGADNVTLAGTLSLPPVDGPHPAVILISGSGPSDRDESLAPLAAIKPLALIADGLTRQGIAVLRYDDRGVGESSGEYDGATSADLSYDAEAALAYLLTREDINSRQIGLLGHSEGGMIAPMVAARNEDVAFVITLSGNAVSGYETLILQNERMLAAAGETEDAIAARVALVKQLMDAVIAEDSAAVEALLREDLEAYYASMSDDERAALGDIDAFLDAQIPPLLAYYQSWMRFFIMHDPAEDWQQVAVPALVCFGGLDTQVDLAQNKPVLESLLAEAGNDDATVVVFDNANHLYQPAVTGGLEEYGTLPQEFVPELLPTITDWLRARVDTAQ